MSGEEKDLQKEEEEMAAMFTSIDKLIRENLTLPVTLDKEDASKLRRFIEKGYVNDVGGTSEERRRLWETALDLQEKIVLEQVEGSPHIDKITIPMFETQISDLEALTLCGLDFGMILDERLDAIEAINHARDSYGKSRSEIQGQ